MLIYKKELYEKILEKTKKIKMKDYYYPLVEELDEKLIESNLNVYLPLIIYYKNNPYKDNVVICAQENYKALVLYCEDFLENKLSII